MKIISEQDISNLRFYADGFKEMGNDVDAEILKKIADRLERLNESKNEIGKVVWEKRYSTTLDDDKFGRWMRIGRVNGVTVAIITKAKVENKQTRFLVRLSNNKGDESLQNSIVALTEKQAMVEAEKYIQEYVKRLK